MSDFPEIDAEFAKLRELEDQRDVADAILYERAARALKRRYDPAHRKPPERIANALLVLHSEA